MSATKSIRDALLDPEWQTFGTIQVHTSPASASTATYAPASFVDAALPRRVVYVENLADRVLLRLARLLETDYRDESRRDLPSYVLELPSIYQEALEYCQGGKGLSLALCGYIMTGVRRTVKDLTGGPIRLERDWTSPWGGFSRIDMLGGMDENFRAILGEVTTPKAFATCIHRFVARAQAGDLFQTRASTSWHDEEAILGKLCRAAWDVTKTCEEFRWSLVFDGVRYIIILIVFVPAERNTRNPVVFCSPILSISAGLVSNAAEIPSLRDHPGQSPRMSLLSFAVYTFLEEASSIPASLLLQELQLSVAEGPSTTLPVNTSPLAMEGSTMGGPGKDAVAAAMPGMLQHWSSWARNPPVQIEAHFPHHGHNVFHLELGPGASSDKTSAMLVFDTFIGIGGVGAVFRSSASQVVFKVSTFADSIEAIRNEAIIYNHLEQQGVGATSMFIGLYSWPGGVGILLTDVGQTLNILEIPFDQLSHNTREALFQQLVQIHSAGVCHGDIEPQNIAYHPGKLEMNTAILDFSHARLHDCPGMLICPELRTVAKLLRIPTSSWPLEEQLRSKEAL